MGLELYKFSTPFGYILPLVESIAKAFRVPHELCLNTVHATRS